MKCPLLKITRPGLMSEAEHPQDDCLKEECAWWNKHGEECCLMSIGRVLNYISTYIHEGVLKMPHEEQKQG